ncbi:MAG: methylmalonyl-CoA epimerase [Bacteroidota bacterium]
MKVEHLGIAVANLEEGEALYEFLLQEKSYKREKVEGEGVLTSFFRAGETKVELLEATRPDSPIAKFIEKRGPGLHHIAFSVPDIRAEMNRLAAAGYRLLNQEPKKGADNKLVCFIHPKDGQGVLIELCQDIGA